MHRPLVSIIVPVYNTAEYVEECIQSILSQSYKNIELILVNDGSTDGSDIVCKKYEHLPNVLCIEQSNSGVVVARKRGVEEARGEWIMFVDSDDLLLDDAICKMVELSDGCNIVVGWHSGNRFLQNAPDSYCWDEYLYFLYSHTGIRTSPWGKLFRKKIISDSPLAFYYQIERSEDFLMNIAIAINNKLNIKVCKDVIYFYRERQSSVVHTKPFSCDYCYNLCNIADSIVKDALPPSKFIIGGIHMRLYYYQRILKEHDYQGYGHHQFPKQIIHLMNKARVLNLKNRILLSLTNRRAIKTYLYLLDCYGSLRIKNKCKHYVHLFLLDHFPKVIISRRWKRKMGYSLDWKHPRDINEKIQWLLVYGDTSEWTRLADKYKVREYVKEKGLEHLLVPLYGVWDDTKQIDFDALPEKFVLKCNHDYGSTILVDKNSADYNRKDICEKLDNCMKKDFGYKGELHYRGIPRKIIAEKYLEMGDSDRPLSSSIIDYKVWCFNGEPCSIITMYDRTKDSLINEAYDLDWNAHPEYLVPNRHCRIGNGKIPKPKSFSEMMEASSILSKGFPEVRVDFYEIDGRLFFGEMTFTSGEGMMKQYTPEYRKILGDLVILPKRKR